MGTLTPEERQVFGALSVKQMEASVRSLPDAPPCPFLETLLPGARCNKRGGVCSIRKYAPGEDKAGVFVPGDKIVTTCPTRFVAEVEDGKSLFSWISEKMLDQPKPIIVKETPFLRKISDARLPMEAAHDEDVAEDVVEEEEAEKKAGRIDWLVVNPPSMQANELEWAAVETQALYFSGGKMITEFQAYAAAPTGILFPLGKRRPDYRSSGPKRLSPQLDVKVPVLQAWGKKVAIVIDKFFFDNMNKLDDVYIRGDERARRDNAAIVWFIVDYDDALRLRTAEIHYTTLDSSRRALNATEPLAKADFTNNLKGVINDPQRTNKVFKVSE
ncbi:NotI family restriction endonuclease [Granulicella mallensis]|uniref:NotI family restriction endonuclease n=1 Tax=Granulicella mallensis TaxID=940614 RepID=UPI0016130089|nr:NotI family restriction endonuclease [Granulicella mallensis]